MKKKLLIFAFMLAVVVGYAQTDYKLGTDDVNEVTIDANGYITACTYDFSANTAGTNLTIPATIGSKTVTGITNAVGYPNGVFYNKGITSVIFPATMQYIGNNAFQNNNITTLDLSHCSVLTTIGDWAFLENDNLTTLNLSNCSELITIGNNAFKGANITTLGLTTVNLSNCTALETIGNNAFQSNLFTTLDLSNCSALETIGNNAFSHGLLAALDLSSCTELTSLGSAICQYTQVATLNLSNCSKLTSIGWSAFQSTKLTELDLSPCTALREIGGWAFGKITTLATLNLSGCTALTAIGDKAFFVNNLSAIDLSPCTALTSIGAEAFAGNQFTEFALPTHAELSSLGWQDGNSNNYAAGDNATDFATSYTIPGNGSVYFTITYHLNGGINNAANPTAYISADGVASFAPASKTGYSFLGWYSDDDFTTQVTEIAQGSTANVELWAKWELPVIPISDWAVVLGVFMITIFIVLRFRRKLA